MPQSHENDPDYFPQIPQYSDAPAPPLFLQRVRGYHMPSQKTPNEHSVLGNEMLWICEVLLCATLFHVMALPTEPVGDARPASIVLQKRGLWKPLSHRHHEWRFPKFVDCGKENVDIYGATGYSADYLIKQTPSAMYKASNQFDLTECDGPVQCWRCKMEPAVKR